MRSQVLEDPVPMSPDQEAVVRECLERAAPDVFGDPAAIKEVRSSKFTLRTSYDAYVLTVRLAAGGEVRLFLKDFSSSLRRKNDPRDRRQREVSVYRELLQGAGLGTARYHGSIMDEQGGRLWLLLEYVDGVPVGYTELGDGWAPAAEALGRMHGCFASQLDRLRGCDFLIEHSADFYRWAAEHAVTNVARVAPHLVGRVEELVRRYEPTVAVMTRHEPTLVHGGCRSPNILIQVASDPSRACILDWEEAGVGAPLFDVAHLVDGIEPPLLDRLLAAYRAGAAAYGMSLPGDDEMKNTVDCFRLYMALNSLARAVLKGYEERDVLNVLDYGESIARGMLRRPQRPQRHR